MKTEKSKTVKQTLFYTAIGLIVSVSSLGLILPHISIKSIQNSSEPPIQVTLQEDTIHTATISSVGDIMAHKPQLDAQYDNKTNSYSFYNNFKYVKDHLSSADLTLGNLETTFAGTNMPFSLTLLMPYQMLLNQVALIFYLLSIIILLIKEILVFLEH